MFRRIFAAVLALCLVFSLFGCTSPQEETQPVTEASETTVPPTTEAPTEAPTEPPSAQELYAEARQVIDEALNLQLEITSSRTRSVNGETYAETCTQSVSLQGIGTEELKATVSDTTTMGEYVVSASEYYDGGTLFTLIENDPFSAPMEQEDFLSRLVPAVLLDAGLYASVIPESTVSGTLITFTEPTAGESWLVSEYAELISAQGTALIGEDGTLSRTTYSVNYTFGPMEYREEYSVSVTIPENLSLKNTLPVSDDAFVQLEYIDAPWMMYRALYDISQTQNMSYTSVDTVISYAGGIIYSQQENLDIYRTENMYNYDLSISLQDYSGTLDEYDLEENLQNKVLRYSENESEPASQLLSAAQATSILDSYVDLPMDFLWMPEDLTGASVTNLGSVYLLGLSGNEALGDLYESVAVSCFWDDEFLLRNLAESYRTETLTAYLSINSITQLPVSFGFSYEGIHTIDGEEYILSDQWDQTIFLGSTSAYEAITEQPLPDVDPEVKATPLFYHVTGENGQEMWLFGTIHVGDDRTGFLPQEIYDALASSDALAVEFDMDAFDEALETDDRLLSQVQDAYFYSDGSMTKDHLDEDVYEEAVKLLKATGNYYMNAEYIKPYLWSQSIDNFLLQQGYGLVSEKGVDNRLLALAREMGLEILDVESGLFQIQMLTSFSEDLQQLLLEDSMNSNSLAYAEGLNDLYEKWCAGDEAVMREELSDEEDLSELTDEELAEYEATKHLLDEYNKAMSYDRNDGMLDVAIDYLESGKTVFYAVGLAHLLNDVNGLVDTLRAAGYTVELVTYQ